MVNRPVMLPLDFVEEVRGARVVEWYRSWHYDRRLVIWSLKMDVGQIRQICRGFNKFVVEKRMNDLFVVVLEVLKVSNCRALDTRHFF